MLNKIFNIFGANQKTVEEISTNPELVANSQKRVKEVISGASAAKKMWNNIRVPPNLHKNASSVLYWLLDLNFVNAPAIFANPKHKSKRSEVPTESLIALNEQGYSKSTNDMIAHSHRELSAILLIPDIVSALLNGRTSLELSKKMNPELKVSSRVLYKHMLEMSELAMDQVIEIQDFSREEMRKRFVLERYIREINNTISQLQLKNRRFVFQQPLQKIKSTILSQDRKRSASANYKSTIATLRVNERIAQLLMTNDDWVKNIIETTIRDMEKSDPVALTSRQGIEYIAAVLSSAAAVHLYMYGLADDVEETAKVIFQSIK